MQEEEHLKILDKEKIKLTATDGDDAPASAQLIEAVPDQFATIPSKADKPWLLVPRIKCDAPGAERLLLRPNIILGFVFGVMLPFVFVHLALTYHQYMNSAVNTGLVIAAGLFLTAQYRFNRYFTFKSRNPFFVEFAVGVTYPMAKLLSFVGLTETEGNCFITLGDCMQEFNQQAYAAECNAKVLSFDKPLKVFSLGSERAFAQSLLLSGQSDRAVHYVEERLRYGKYIFEQSQNAEAPNEQALSEYAMRCHFAVIIYESIGEVEKATKLREDVFDKVKTRPRLGEAYNTGALCKAESLYSNGDFEDAAKVLEEYFGRVKQVKWDSLFSYSSFMKARAAIFLARCYAKIGNETKTSDFADIAKIETEKDRSTINKINEQFMLAEIVHSKGNVEQAKDILLKVKDNFLTEQSSHVAFLLKQKAVELGFTELFLELAEPIHPSQNEAILCKHDNEDCSYLDGPVKVVAEMSVAHRSWLAGCFVATVGLLGRLLSSSTGPTDTRDFCIFLAPILIFLVWVGLQKNRKMAKLRKSIHESTGTPVKVKLDKFCNLVIYDPDTSLSIGKFGINDDFHEALVARIDEEFPAKMYKKDDEILGLQMFGYVTMVSKPKS
ncbi:hypothetical protein BH10CYA1_BH10CYA1_26160 [soil metagenome]